MSTATVIADPLRFKVPRSDYTLTFPGGSFETVEKFAAAGYLDREGVTEMLTALRATPHWENYSSDWLRRSPAVRALFTSNGGNMNGTYNGAIKLLMILAGIPILWKQQGFLSILTEDGTRIPKWDDAFMGVVGSVKTRVEASQDTVSQLYFSELLTEMSQYAEWYRGYKQSSKEEQMRDLTLRVNRNLKIPRGGAFSDFYLVDDTADQQLYQPLSINSSISQPETWTNRVLNHQIVTLSHSAALSPSNADVMHKHGIYFLHAVNKVTKREYVYAGQTTDQKGFMGRIFKSKHVFMDDADPDIYDVTLFLLVVESPDKIVLNGFEAVLIGRNFDLHSSESNNIVTINQVHAPGTSSKAKTNPLALMSIEKRYTTQVIHSFMNLVASKLPTIQIAQEQIIQAHKGATVSKVKAA